MQLKYIIYFNLLFKFLEFLFIFLWFLVEPNWFYSWKLMKEEIKEIKCSKCYLNLDFYTFHLSISATHLRKGPFVNIDFYDWFIDCMYRPVWEYFTQGHHHCQFQWLQKIKWRPMYGIYSLWSGMNLCCSIPAMTWDLGLYGLIQKVALFSHLLQQTRDTEALSIPDLHRTFF